ncbi:MAG: geranylgeranylglyceryl/heptaprenylglyceryl phosphate synthase [Bacteroidales bacterium]|jgi:putative glycerol-1-phosphate prenyltransferase|nr:geranylgeranylglyceryl/heptaprenylglyceryl phosphate synthase [Bacteroidales bacterium]
MTLYDQILDDTGSGKKKFAVLIDPDKNTLQGIKKLTQLANTHHVDYFFIGGSLLMKDHIDEYISHIRGHSAIPVVLFPGNNLQLNKKANGILLLSVISGRNPELLIGRHVVSAPFLKESNLEILPTGYMLIDGKNMSTVAYMSNTNPIPSTKNDIAACTAMAGEMLGLKLIYMDAGSGAIQPAPPAMIHEVKSHIGIPLIVGGGITTPETADKALRAGADMIVVGNAIEKDPGLIPRIAEAVRLGGR